MTFKTNAIKRTVTGTFQRPDGSPSEGILKIKLLSPVQGREENVIYTSQQLDVELDATGSFSKELAVSAPGLTISEQAELTSVINQKATLLQSIAAKQEEINVYLRKLQAGDTVTQAETDTYNTNLEEKRDLQRQQVGLVDQETVLMVKQKKLEENPSILQVWAHLENPKENKKLRFVIKPGEGPIDLADIPLED